jgi:hypothetical protein
MARPTLLQQHLAYIRNIKANHSRTAVLKTPCCGKALEVELATTKLGWLDHTIRCPHCKAIIRVRSSHTEHFPHAEVERAASKRRLKSNAGSTFDQIGQLRVGESLLLERAVDQCVNTSRNITAASRYPASMQDMRFSTRSFTGVEAGVLGSIIGILKVTRIA